MTVELNLDKSSARLSVALLSLVGCLLLLVVVVSRFVVGTLADERLAVTRDTLRAPIGYFPSSARLNGRIAAAEMSESDRDLSSATLYAERATSLSPFDYRFRLTLAAVKEAGGDRQSAEESLRAATLLAPNYWSVHYRLANLLVREGKLDESLGEFQKAVEANDSLLPGTLDLVWRASGGNAAAVGAASGRNAKAKLALAQFLLNKSDADEAAGVFGSIDRDARIASPVETSTFLNSLIGSGKFEAARNLWGDMTGADRRASIVWNGSFESDVQKDFNQFDWSFGRSEYARLSFDSNVAHTGSRSLKIEFIGRDTTQLDNELKQLVAVRPGVRYVLECYARTGDLNTPEGPRLVVTDVSGSWVAVSESIGEGTNDWRRLSIEFVLPATARSAVFVSIKRKPKFSYDEPTSGTIWLDDFSMREL